MKKDRSRTAPIDLESPESASPIVTRAVAGALRGEPFEAYSFSPVQRVLLRTLGRFPQSLARFAISRFETQTGLDPSLLQSFSIDTLIGERLRDYSGRPGESARRFPTVTVGSAMGASAHLALAAGGPFLPQAFVTTLKGGSPDGDVHAYFRRSADLAEEISRCNPSILTIQHFDPVHDGWMTRFVNHLRFKLLELPSAYADFLRRRLEPGGAVLYLDCGARWLHYRIAERSIFQVGGWGDISPQEFLDGSPRLDNYCRAAGLKAQDWRLTGFPLEWGAESEWGSEPGLGEALEAFCNQEGFRFVRIALPAPHDYSRLAFQVAACQLDLAGQQPAGVLIEMFSQIDPQSVLQTGLLPVWLVFNTWDSLAFLKEMIIDFPHDRPVFFSPLATFTITPDLVPWEKWEQALEGLDWWNIGARRSHYPGDALALTEWAEPLHRWAQQNPHPIGTRLPPEQMAELAPSFS